MNLSIAESLLGQMIGVNFKGAHPARSIALRLTAEPTAVVLTIAGAMTLLLSPMASFVTGHKLFADGGSTAWSK